MLEHGGKLLAASQAFGVPLTDWIDLSTGIAPMTYPIPDIPVSVWQRLPEEDDGLHDAACAYYGAQNLLAVNGSQATIMALPRLRSPGSVAVLSPAMANMPPLGQLRGMR